MSVYDDNVVDEDDGASINSMSGATGEIGEACQKGEVVQKDVVDEI